MDFKFDGHFEVHKDREEVYALLTDPRRFGPLLPNLEHIEIHNEREFTVQVKVGLAFMKSTATLQMALSEAAPPSTAVYVGTGKVAGEAIAITASFHLDGNGPGTAVKWVGEANISGRMPAGAAGLLEPVARQSIQTLVNSFKAALV